MICAVAVIIIGRSGWDFYGTHCMGLVNNSVLLVIAGSCLNLI